jgi:MinD-like ATPase involved in chromosome partitioning or flagellar assembly
MSGTPHRRLLVTVDSPSGRHALEVPEGARIDDLVPSLVEVCEGGASDAEGWSLAPMGETPLTGDETLGGRGLFPGAVLVLTAPDHRGKSEPEPDAHPAADVARRLGAGLRSVGPRRPAPGSAAPPPNIDRISDADYLRLLESAITAPGSGASTVVAVMSAHPGAGTTTITALLATLLASLRNDQVGAVDACPQSGALSHWMAPESGFSSGPYRSLFEPAPTPEQVRGAMVPIGRGLALLPAPSDHGHPSADRAAWELLIQHLRHLHNILILDCGAGFRGAVSRAALGAADQVVLVSKAAPDDLDKLGPAIESIRRLGRPVVVVANQAPERSRIKPSAAGVQQLTLPYEPQPANRLKTRGFSWSDAPNSWQESIRELAAVLIGSAQRG